MTMLVILVSIAPPSKQHFHESQEEQLVAKLAHGQVASVFFVTAIYTKNINACTKKASQVSVIHINKWF